MSGLCIIEDVLVATCSNHSIISLTGTGENVESSGKAKSVLSKAKRKLKDKIKKVRGGNTASTEHGDKKEYDKRDFNDVLGPDGEEVDDGAESYEDDEEEEDHMGKTNNNQVGHCKVSRVSISNVHVLEYM